MKTIKEINPKGKRILVRCDFNVPISEKGKILDDIRIRMGIPAIKYLIKRKARTILISHLGRPKGRFVSRLRLKPIKERLEKYLRIRILGPMDCLKKETKEMISGMREGDVALLENIRFYKGEIENRRDFSRRLAELGDIFVNNAFSVCHRSQASVSGIARLLPSFAGPDLLSEIRNLSKVLKNPKRPLVAIIGGRKIEDKARVVKKFAKISDFVLVGNLVANALRKENRRIENRKKIIFPSSNKNMPDLDRKTIEIFKEKIGGAKTIFWAGPLGKIEEKRYQKGTTEIARAIIASGAFSVVGGGDTIKILNRFSLLKRFSFVSTGGGAMLSFLAGERLAGLEALERQG